VQWQLNHVGPSYARRLDPATKAPFPENNWVWSPQGVVDMHLPERWGFVQFSPEDAGSAQTPFMEHRNERVKWALRRLYYRQQQFRAANGRYAADLSLLDAHTIAVDGLDFKPSLQVTDSMFELRANGFDGAVVRLREDGRVWIE
jgi:hypothetical protein